MKLFIFLSLFSFSAFATQTEYSVKTKDMSAFVCNQVLNVISFDSCVSKLNACIKQTMSRNIYVPIGESQQFLDAVKECSMSL